VKTRIWMFSTITAALAIAAVLALVLPLDGSQDQALSPVAGVIPGTAGTVMTVADRDKVVAQQADQPAEVSGYPFPLPEPRPGEIHGPGCGDSRVFMVKRTNSWGAGGLRGEEYLAVNICAGAYRRDPDTGYLVVSRTRFPGDTASASILVPHSGPVRITDAPLGEEGSAHVWDALIRFDSARGTVGYIDLSDDSLHITGGPVEGVCPEGTFGTPPNCVLTEAKLGTLHISPKNRVVKPGGETVFTAKIKNNGRAATNSVDICVTAPKKLVRFKKWCLPINTVPSGQTATRKFRMQVKHKAKPGKRLAFQFEAVSTAIDRKSRDVRNTQVTIKVK